MQAEESASRARSCHSDAAGRSKAPLNTLPRGGLYRLPGLTRTYLVLRTMYEVLDPRTTRCYSRDLKISPREYLVKTQKGAFILDGCQSCSHAAMINNGDCCYLNEARVSTIFYPASETICDKRLPA
jgi:hypothetical protein